MKKVTKTILAVLVGVVAVLACLAMVGSFLGVAALAIPGVDPHAIPGVDPHVIPGVVRMQYLAWTRMRSPV